jgi:acetyltransferase-like isoleucine patch superfamily enzyme
MMDMTRNYMKQVARGLASWLVVPLVVSYAVRARLLGRDRALEGSSQALAWLPGVAGQYLRNAFLRAVLAECHPSATICFGTTFSRSGARIGENAYIGAGCNIGLAHIERDVLIGSGVHVPSGSATHGIADLSIPIREQPGDERMVRIGSGAWIGNAAVIMADVGRKTVVGAGSVVTRPLAPFAIAAGVPARVVKLRGEGQRTTG